MTTRNKSNGIIPDAMLCQALAQGCTYEQIGMAFAVALAATQGDSLEVADDTPGYAIACLLVDNIFTERAMLSEKRRQAVNVRWHKHDADKEDTMNTKYTMNTMYPNTPEAAATPCVSTDNAEQPFSCSHENDGDDNLASRAHANMYNNNIVDVNNTDRNECNIKDNISEVANATSTSPFAQNSPKTDRLPSVDTQKYIDAWNAACERYNAAMPRVQSITGRRLAMLKARLKDYDEQQVIETFGKAAASSFLNGGGSSGFIANIDWVLRPNNFVKVLEGNYDTRARADYSIGTGAIDNSIEKWAHEAEKWGQ